MNIQDVNNWLVPSDGFTITSLSVEGAYLRVQCSQTVYKKDTTEILGWNQEDIFLNDQGREVVRTRDFHGVINWGSEPTPSPEPVGRGYRFKNGFLIALQGLEEMVKCLKKQSLK
jgi:hypothetical protein